MLVHLQRRNNSLISKMLQRTCRFSTRMQIRRTFCLDGNDDDNVVIRRDFAAIQCSAIDQGQYMVVWLGQISRLNRAVLELSSRVWVGAQSD
jgi:hypothetical protein